MSSVPPARKKPISIDEVSKAFVRALLDDVDQGFESLIGLVRQFDPEKRIPPTQTLHKEEFALALFALELRSVPNLFEREVSERITSLCIAYLAHSLGRTDREINSQISLYESIFSEHAEAGLNPLVAVSETLYERMGIPAFRSERYPKITGPDPIIVSALATVLATGIGRWKRLSDSFCVA